MALKVLLIEDHALVRAALNRLLSDAMGATVAEAADTEAGLVAVRRERPDVVVLDLALRQAGGLTLMPVLAEMRLRVLVLSMHTEPIYAQRALEAGALGYVSKNVAPGELVDAVRQVAAGRHYLEPRIAQALALGQIDGAALTKRELELLRLLAAGSSLGEIGQALGLSYKTVANNLSLLRGKLGVNRTAELIRFAIGMQEREG